MSDAPSPPVRLDDLVAAVDARARSPLDGLVDAVRLAEELGATADALVGHFVDRARGAGASWADIGRSLGTSKQAAQKRFVARGPAASAPLDPSQGFSRFRDDARTLVVAAQEHARRAGNDTIGASHLVLALVDPPGSTAARAVEAQSADLEQVAALATATLPPPAAAVPALVPFDPHARAVLEGGFAVAQRHGADAVGSEHILLSLLEAEDGTGVLAGLGVTPGGVEAFLGHR